MLEHSNEGGVAVAKPLHERPIVGPLADQARIPIERLQASISHMGGSPAVDASNVAHQSAHAPARAGGYARRGVRSIRGGGQQLSLAAQSGDVLANLHLGPV